MRPSNALILPTSTTLRSPQLTPSNVIFRLTHDIARTAYPINNIMLSRSTLLNAIVACLVAAYIVVAIPQHWSPSDFLDGVDQTTLDICPELNVKCVIDGDWRHPVGELGKKRESLWYGAMPYGPESIAELLMRETSLAFCRSGIRCNQCDELKNTHECNRSFRAECHGECEAYGPIPF